MILNPGSWRDACRAWHIHKRAYCSCCQLFRREHDSSQLCTTSEEFLGRLSFPISLSFLLIDMSAILILHIENSVNEKLCERVQHLPYGCFCVYFTHPHLAAWPFSVHDRQHSTNMLVQQRNLSSYMCELTLNGVAHSLKKHKNSYTPRTKMNDYNMTRTNIHQ